MYNAELKNSFVDTYRAENSYKTLYTLFDMVEPFEEKFGKDICDMNIDEMTIILNNIGVKRTTRQARASLLKMYIDFCIKNGKTKNTENVLEKIFIGAINNNSSTMMAYIKDPDEFEDIIKKMFEEQYKVDDANVIDEIIWRLLYYYELPVDVIPTIKKSDIDYETGILTVGDKKIDLDEKILKLIKQYNDLTYVYIPGKYGYRKTELNDNEYVVRKTKLGTGDAGKGSTFVVRSINRLITRNMDAYNSNSDVYKKLTPVRITDSHVFYRIYSSGDPMQYIKETIRAEKHLDANKLTAFKNNYISWEKAFF